MIYIIPAVIVILLVALIKFILNKDRLEPLNTEVLIISLLATVISFSLIITIDKNGQTTDQEIWSGKITKVEHKEEWDEWIPPKIETYTTTDSKGNVTTHTNVIPGYWEHHYAENYITTSDKGTFSVSKVPDGTNLTDDFVNSTDELAKYYPIGSPTASIHKFENKVKASYSIYKHDNIDLEEYPDLPEYPIQVKSDFTIDRLIGNFKNKNELSMYLNKINSNLNDTNNPNNKDGVKSYKQVNLIIVNFGDKPEDYGYALQDYWENGAKNDIVVTFGTDSEGKPTWCYVFSWSEVEILKSDIREVIMNLDNINNDFKSSLDKISELIENKFVRKQFADFDYIQIDVRPFSKVLMLLILIFAIVALIIL